MNKKSKTMDEKTFKVWASGCAHVNADKKMGRDSLGEAIIDSEKYFNWDIGINIGDFSAAIGLPSDEEGEEVVNQFKQLKTHKREDIYTICGNHDRNSPQQPEGMWFQKWLDPIGENSKFSEVKKENYTFPIKGTFEKYYFDVGNIRFLMMSDINPKNQKKGRGELGGHPTGAVSKNTFDWWVNQIEENHKNKILVSAHHYMLRNTTVASGDWEGMKKDENGSWQTNYHGYFSKGTPISASYLSWVGNEYGKNKFENWLNDNPGKLDIWMGGHTHTNPDDSFGGKTHVERKYGGTMFVNVSALTRWHVKRHAIPMSRLFTFNAKSEFASVECFLHSDDFLKKGFYHKKKIDFQLSKKFQF